MTSGAVLSGAPTGSDAPNDSGVDFRILGPLEVVYAGRPVPITGARQRTVLGMLLLCPAGAPVSVDTLVQAVWDGHPPMTGRTQVSICVAAIRKAFRQAGRDGEVVVTAAPGYRLALEGHRLDAYEFSARVSRARTLAQQHRPERAVEMFRSALALWRGPVLADIRSDLVRATVAHHEEERLSAYEQYTALRLEVGQHRALVGELTEMVRQDPDWEQIRAYLMLAYYRCGRRAEALETFRQGRDRAIAELGLEPGPVLTEMHRSVLRDDPALDVPAGSAAGAATTEVVPAQLPPDEPVFVGREAELATLDDGLLGDRGRDRPLRWGQLTGGVGVGKTTLALRWAHRVAPEFPDGQLFADLRGFDPRREPAAASTVLDQFIQALGVPYAQVPDSTDARVALYHSLLADRRILVVLDNARSLAQMQPLLPGTGSCRVIVTCREPLHGSAAVRRRLARLSTPEAETMLRRAVGDERGDDEPAALTELVQLCDRLPLALRTAAARLAAKPHWTVCDLVRRLADRERRLAELEHSGGGVAAGLDLSYAALPAPSAVLFRRLSLLEPRAVPVPAAAALLQVDVREAEDLLEQLVDVDLVEAVERDEHGLPRFRLVGLRRLYAWQRARCDDSPEQRAAARARVGQWWPGLVGHDARHEVNGGTDDGAADR